MKTDALTRSLIRLRLAMSRIDRRGPPSPRRRPPLAGAVTVEPPRAPTLSGGAAAPLDA